MVAVFCFALCWINVTGTMVAVTFFGNKMDLMDTIMLGWAHGNKAGHEYHYDKQAGD